MEKAPFWETFILISIYTSILYVLSSNTIVLMLNFFFSSSKWVHLHLYLLDLRCEWNRWDCLENSEGLHSWHREGAPRGSRGPAQSTGWWSRVYSSSLWSPHSSRSQSATNRIERVKWIKKVKIKKIEEGGRIVIHNYFIYISTDL